MTRPTMAVLLMLLSTAPGLAVQPPAAGSIRVATFNIWELSDKKANDVVGSNPGGANGQLQNAAAIVQTVRPDVLLISEIDAGEETTVAFLKNYLAVAHAVREPIDYPHLYSAPVNTGVPSGLDLNNDGDTGDPDDAWGFGAYSGQYGMALYSRFPVDRDGVRTFQKFLWSDMPDHTIPDGRDGRPLWYSADVASQLRLSSKSHWDVPIRIGDETMHILASHPTPPVFDGAEDRNGRRNFDEIRLWADYLTGGPASRYIVDDKGLRGGLAAGEHVVLLGDLNSDPRRGETIHGKSAVEQLLSHPRLHDAGPVRTGAVAEEERDKTAHFGRLDYVLPGRSLEITGSGVFWPAGNEPLAGIAADREKSSDHCLVWVDLRFAR